jgi:hypothetical protein
MFGRADAALELAAHDLAIAAHRRAIDRYIVLDWPDKEALERERLREALHQQAARRAAMTSARTTSVP